jgi:hypothetical protein
MNAHANEHSIDEVPSHLGASQWFLNTDYLSEIDEEYRRKNQLFRKFVKSVAGAAGHPLGFLLKMKDKKGRLLFDAGHVVPVKVLAQRGTKLERLVVEDRTLNRGKHATQISGIVNVQGVPVDCASVAAWATVNPQLGPYVADCNKTNGRKHSSEGWYSSDKTVHELEFVLTLPGEVWTRSRDVMTRMG